MMKTTQRFHRNSKSKLLESRLTPFLGAYKDQLIERRYTAGIVSQYLGCVTHFARWLNLSRLDIHRIDEAAIRRFLDVHLPHCKCAKAGLWEKKKIMCGAEWVIFFFFS